MRRPAALLFGFALLATACTAASGTATIRS
jgi:hypothetical protein